MQTYSIRYTDVILIQMKALKCKTLGDFGSILNFVVRCYTWYILTMHMPLLDVDVANKNAQFIAHDGMANVQVDCTELSFLALSLSPPSFSMFNTSRKH